MNELQMMFIVKALVRIFLLVAIILFIFLRYMESKMLFYPAMDLEVFPDQAGLKFQEVFFETEDKVKLNGWMVPAQGARYTILFCHGNAGNISHRLEKIRFFHERGYNVFIFDYRGYGRSLGRPSEKGLYKDVDAAYRYLMSLGIADGAVIGYGESLGGAVITELASKGRLKALILDSTFSSIKDMARAALPFFPSWVFVSRFDTEGKLRSISCPKLIIHSVNDEIVPYRLGHKIFASAREPKVFLQVRGGHNSNFYESEEVLRTAIEDFVGRLR